MKPCFSFKIFFKFSTDQDEYKRAITDELNEFFIKDLKKYFDLQKNAYIGAAVLVGFQNIYDQVSWISKEDEKEAVGNKT